jgi:tetratricopeptide (TPR) repeat protein
MRTLKLLPIVVVVCSLAATASAQQVGDKIVVTTEKAPLRSQDATTGSVPKGAILVVKNVNGDRFWVVFSSGHETVNGWINRSVVVPYSEALEFFKEELKRNPTANAYNNLGMLWADTEEYHLAIENYNEAIRLDPNAESAYNNRGIAWAAQGEDDKAIADYNEAIRLDPKDAFPYLNRGNAWSAKGDYDKAIADYSEAIRLDPKYASAWRARAWLAAASPDAKYRDGKKAVVDATKACELSASKDWDSLDTLAAAYAESGDFPNAVKWEEKAIELAPEQSKGDLRSRLDLFKAHKPHHEELRK